MKVIEKKHPLAIRWFHWINFPVLGVMIWSGLLIYWANDIYRVGWGDKTLIRFFPNTFNDIFHIPFRLAEGMAFHFVFMWLFFINGILYVSYTIFSGEWRELMPNRKSFVEAIQVTLHDLHLRKEKPPQGMYNSAQKIAYTSIIFMGIGSILTGLAIYKPTQFHILTSMLGGYEAARIEHFILTIGYVLFFVVHIAQVIRAGWNNFRSIVTGYEINEVELAAEAPVTEIPPTAIELIIETPITDSDIAEESPKAENNEQEEE